MVLLTVTTAFGVVGELLAVAAPVKTCAVPVVETVPKGSTNVNGAAAATVLETCTEVIKHFIFARMSAQHTLMIVWFVDVLRTTLQNNVPVRAGRVLGRY
jgi:hypothetical protein